MAARAIVGILLGILFAPVIYLLLLSIGNPNVFANWFWLMTKIPDNRFFINWGVYGVQSTIVPAHSVGYLVGLIQAFDPNVSLLTYWLPIYLPALITWTIIGAWAGAIERSAGRGIAVGGGIWLGWMLAGIIGTYMIPEIENITLNILWDIWNLLFAQILTLVVVIVVAAIFGAMTRTEEF